MNRNRMTLMLKCAHGLNSANCRAFCIRLIQYASVSIVCSNLEFVEICFHSVDSCWQAFVACDEMCQRYLTEPQSFIPKNVKYSTSHWNRSQSKPFLCWQHSLLSFIGYLVSNKSRPFAQWKFISVFLLFCLVPFCLRRIIGIEVFNWWKCVYYAFPNLSHRNSIKRNFSMVWFRFHSIR